MRRDIFEFLESGFHVQLNGSDEVHAVSEIRKGAEKAALNGALLNDGRFFKFCDVMPYRWTRFITPDYEDLFMVDDGGFIILNGERRQVKYLDETHFDLNGYCYHICQFAERARDLGWEVKKV